MRGFSLDCSLVRGTCQASHLTFGYCWPTSFKVLEVLFLGGISSAFLPSKKACWTHKFRHMGGGQQYPPVISTHAELSQPRLDPCRATHSRNQRRVAPRCRRLFNTRPCWQPCWHNVVLKICETMGGDRSSQARKSRENPCSQRHLITGHLNIWREQEKKKRQQCGTETKTLTLRA